MYESPQVKALKTPARKKGAMRLPSYIPDRLFSEALAACLLDQNPRESLTNPLEFERRLKKGLEKHRTPAADTIEGFWTAADFDITKFNESLKQWFNDTTDRLPGSFKRRITISLLIVGFIVSVALNANSLHMYRQLTDDPQLRLQYLDKAVEVSQQAVSPSLEGVCPEGTVCTPSDVAKRQALVVMPLIGWSKDSPPLANFDGSKLDGGWYVLWIWLYSVVGWILTAAALSLGAPFWFDLLQKFVKVRGSLAPAPTTGAPQTGAAGEPGTAAEGAAPAQAIDLDDFDSFQRGILAFNKVNALWMGRFAELAYHTPQEVDVRLQEWGLSGAWHQGARGTEFITVDTPRLSVLAFRGTEPKEPR